jgi:hypothetical protein
VGRRGNPRPAPAFARIVRPTTRPSARRRIGGLSGSSGGARCGNRCGPMRRTDPSTIRLIETPHRGVTPCCIQCSARSSAGSSCSPWPSSLSLFGSSQLPKLARSLGGAEKEFERGFTQGVDEEDDGEKKT